MKYMHAVMALLLMSASALAESETGKSGIAAADGDLAAVGDAANQFGRSLVEDDYDYDAENDTGDSRLLAADVLKDDAADVENDTGGDRRRALAGEEVESDATGDDESNGTGAKRRALADEQMRAIEQRLLSGEEEPNLTTGSDSGGRALRSAAPEPEADAESETEHGRSLATQIVYNGNTYRMLDNKDASAKGVGCQVGYKTIPYGWAVAPNNADSKWVASNYHWGTHCVITSTGQSWATKAYLTPGSDCWFDKTSPVHHVNGLGQWKVTSCNRRILLKKIIQSYPQVTYKGNTYRLLDGTYSGVQGVGCQTNYLSIPHGWSVAGNTADSKWVASNYHWGTHCVITSTGQSWATMAYLTPGSDCWFDKTSPVHHVNGLGQWKVTSCSRRILLIKEKQFGGQDNGDGTVVYENNLYRALDETDPDEEDVGCQTKLKGVPKGWIVAPATTESKDIAANYHWGTHCMVLSDGSSWGTQAYTPGIDCWFNKKHPVVKVKAKGKKWKVISCNRRVLLQKECSLHSKKYKCNKDTYCHWSGGECLQDY